MSSPRVRARMEMIKPKKRKTNKQRNSEDDKKAQYIYFGTVSS